MNRNLKFFKLYFHEFYDKQDHNTRAKILYVINLVLDLKIVPKTFFKRISGSQGIYEVRVKYGQNSFRIFSFIDDQNNLVLLNCCIKKVKRFP
jgi:putative component of toxin-antitoxin plasmid stabilization module